MSSDASFSDQPIAAPASGDAGSSFLSGLLNTPADPEGAKRLNEGAAGLKNLAMGGGFAINQAGLDKYTKVCDEFIDGYRGIEYELQILARQPQMGSSQYAEQVATFNVKVATGDHDSLVPNLELLIKGFQQVKEALTIARKNYSETEDAHSQTFAKLRGGE
ncbi:hypothetical protein [Amycolatopsis sp. WQ 127309]|uniref:hypothetical protein n=1 Tax=Amycolatopsis sp. WQ 127309 TaxID=2932773 RepID=UPI001FF6CA62|nr:hypothetical protein [Amycolatopsis sp. WQ 127309]UOZ08121.1 hypothetical protein MUY22_07560 [Amycolatopsis sp. WQ 127309]